jgi:hypothetical protein
MDVRLKLTRAREYIPLIVEQINSFIEKKPYMVWEENNPKRGGFDVRIRYTCEVDRRIVLESGTVITLIRSALDNLACTLALRTNPDANTRQILFPIARSKDEFFNGKRPAVDKIKLLSAADRAKIIGLKPYIGGNDLLYALHELRRLDYHNRLINSAGYVGHVSVRQLCGSCEIGGDVDTWGAIENERTLVWVNGYIDLNFSLNICFNEVGHTQPEPIPDLLTKFIAMAEDIVGMFG